MEPKELPVLNGGTNIEPTNSSDKTTFVRKSKTICCALVFILLSALLGAFVVNTVLNGKLEDWIGINLRWRPICMTKECVSAAHELIKNMDDQVDPCEDFYSFACSRFISRVSQR